jgi:glycerol-3-phosphate dehydrogenase
LLAAIIDHRQDGSEGVLSVDETQFTTAYHTAVNVLDQISRLWGFEPAPSASATTPLRGGEMQSFSEYLNREMAVNSWKLSEPLLRTLIYNYGSEYSNVLDYLPVKPWNAHTLQEQEAVLTAQIHHAVYKEMALKLADFVFRRTELADVGQPNAEILRFCAQTMGKVLDWEDGRIRQEIDEVNAQLALMVS